MSEQGVSFDGAAPASEPGLQAPCRRSWRPSGATLVMLGSVISYALIAGGCVSTAGIEPLAPLRSTAQLGIDAAAPLPAQKATGNSITVVQRMPLGSGIGAQELAAHPSRVGLSMDVEVDACQQGGRTLADMPRRQPPTRAAVFEPGSDEAQAMVQRIIVADPGRPVAPAGTHNAGTAPDAGAVGRRLAGPAAHDDGVRP